MRILLLFAFEAMPEIRLNEEENPKEVRKSVVIKRSGSCMGFSIKIENKKYPPSESNKERAVL